MKRMTLEYYNRNAEEFVNVTQKADVSALRERFLSYLPETGRILDWGCGSGRDSLAMRQAGYEIEAVDASENLCEIARKYAKVEVRCEYFQELKCEDRYDGIWACASLLHLAKEEVPEVLRLAERALKQKGVMYASFKYGSFEGERNGRYFTDLTKARFAQILEEIPGLRMKEQWITQDVRKDREMQQWLNVILEKEAEKFKKK